MKGKCTVPFRFVILPQPSLHSRFLACRMRRLQTIATFCVAALFSTSVAFAQSTTTASNGKKLSGKLIRGSEIMGAKLFNQKGEHIGEIQDILFDENTGGMTHGIVSVGGWLGIGDKLSAVPWNLIHQSKSDSPGFVVEVEKSKLTSSEQFGKDSMPDFGDSWFHKNYESYGLTAHKGKKLVRLSQVNGADLFNQDATAIGEIKDVLMHPNSGKVAYGILSLEDSFVADGDKLTAVPWNLIRQSKKDTQGFVLNTDKMKLDQAAHFDGKKWPEFNDQNWNMTTYTYYGVEPFWHQPAEYQTAKK